MLRNAPPSREGRDYADLSIPAILPAVSNSPYRPRDPVISPSYRHNCPACGRPRASFPSIYHQHCGGNPELIKTCPTSHHTSGHRPRSHTFPRRQAVGLLCRRNAINHSGRPAVSPIQSSKTPQNPVFRAKMHIKRQNNQNYMHDLPFLRPKPSFFTAFYSNSL